MYESAVDEAVSVFLAVLGQAAVDIEEISVDDVSLLRQHACHGEGVTTVVTRSCKDHDGRGLAPLLRDGEHDGACRTLHKVYGGYWFVFDCVVVELMDLCSSQYFHIVSLLFVGTPPVISRRAVYVFTLLFSLQKYQK